MNDLTGHEKEFFAVAQAVAAADNRGELERAQNKADFRQNSLAERDNLQNLYEQSHLTDLTAQLADVLGHSWSIDHDHTVQNTDQFESDETYIAQPIRVGSRIAPISWSASGVTDLPVTAIHGEVVYYRVPYETDRLLGNIQYVDRAFYCLLLQPKADETKTIAPMLSFGDLDDALWQYPTGRDLLETYLGNGPKGTAHTPDIKDIEKLVLNLTGLEEYGRFKRHYRVGLLRANATPWVGGEDVSATANVSDAMDRFISSRYEPLKTNPAVAEAAQVTIEQARELFLINKYEVSPFDVMSAVAKQKTVVEAKKPVFEILDPLKDLPVRFGDVILPALKEYPCWPIVYAEAANALKAEREKTHTVPGKEFHLMQEITDGMYLSRQTAKMIKASVQSYKLSAVDRARILYNDPSLT